MENHLIKIFEFVTQAFLHIWPYLLITIPIAVLVRISGGSKYIGRALRRKPLIAILAATIVGAVSPFCSCGVIPVVSSLLIGGVPLAPVMSFWIASPSMDPEMFFLSVSMLGWELAVWRLAATLFLSIGAGLVTHYLMRRGWLGDNILVTGNQSAPTRISVSLKSYRQRIWLRIKALDKVLPFVGRTSAPPVTCCVSPNAELTTLSPGYTRHEFPTAQPKEVALAQPDLMRGNSCGCSISTCGETTELPLRKRLLKETADATILVLKFMTLAFLIEAIITLYIPAAWITGLLGHSNRWAILSATLIGVPAYTSNLTALPMISGLLGQGMDRAAALAFLIAGPTTTLPAMAAVWGIVSRRVFILYVSIALLGALLFGYIYSLAQMIL